MAMEEPVSTLAATPLDTLSLALLSQQLPALPSFSGDQPDCDGENFSEWLERLELVASTCRWSDQTKLVNVATRLRGAAARYYRSCTPQQRSSYRELTEALRRRFTPVQIQSVQSSRFHERKQGVRESVDDYAQDLQRLFHRAYARTAHIGGGAEQMGQSVLQYQFIAGLQADLKAKVVGCSGSFEELLSKARFEEARLREMAGDRLRPRPREGNGMGEGARRPNPYQPPTNQKGKAMGKGGNICYNCGGEGHYARDCPQKGRGLPVESPGRSSGGRHINMVASSGEHDHDETSVVPPETPSQSVVEEAVQRLVATMHGIETRQTQTNAFLQPTPTSEILLDEEPVQALLDTGSPVTIVSLNFFLKVAAQRRTTDQSPREWGESIRSRLKPSTVTLRSYGGDKLTIVSQVCCQLRWGAKEMNAVLQVQNGAPVDLLLGTDVLGRLGFGLVQQEGEGHTTDLLKQTDRETGETGGPGHKDAGAPAAVVKLLQATRLPARHSRLIRVGIANDKGAVEEMTLFEPETQTLNEKGLAMADAVVGVGSGGEVTLVIVNHGTSPVHLPEGEVLGRLHPAVVVDDPVNTPEEERVRNRSTAVEGSGGRSDQHIAAVCPDTVTQEERRHQLLATLKLEEARLTEDESRQVTGLVNEYLDLFALSSTELGRTTVVEHSIDTTDHLPVKQPPRRVPFALRGKVVQLMDEMLAQGVITPSSSPWASPIVLVAKKDGSTRFCVDYRKLNAITKLDVFPLPRIDESLDLLSGTEYFSSLDLASGYWQVGMEPAAREKTAFTTHSGLYEFQVMPFGLCNAPATFQRLMENVLAGLARDKCLVYLDDILVIGQSLDEHLSNLREVFSRLQRAGLRLKPTKCKLLRKEVEFLGHVVSRYGIKADPKKVTAVAEFPPPKDLRALRAFLGLTSYYRRFVPCFSAIAQPLYALTRKDTQFNWSAECETAFDHLKMILTKAPILAYPRFGEEFLLETDASGVGLGAVLSQEQPDKTIRPVAFASRTLQQHERNYGISELEGLGVVWAVKHFRHYLYGHRCTVFTDHEALKSLLNTAHPSGKLARWGMALQELDLKIEYRPGKSNGRADALSRYPVSLLTSDCSSTQTAAVIANVDASSSRAESGEGRTLAERQREDTSLAIILAYLQRGELPEEEEIARQLVLGESVYTVLEGVLYHVEPDKTLRIIPPTSERRKLFSEAHEGPFSGHLREAKMHSQLSRHYWWRGMRRDISCWCRACLPCAKRGVGRPARPFLTPIPVNGPFDRVGVDVMKMPKTKGGNGYIVVFMDYLTKWPEAFATPDQTSLTIARLFVEKIVSRHGVPRQLLSDRGPAFLSKLFLGICSVLGVKKVNTTAYHPQTDGLVERFNRTLVDMLAKRISCGGKEWDEILPYALFAYRSTAQSSTGESPFRLLYGRDPQLPTESMLESPTRRETVPLDDYQAAMTQQMGEMWAVAQRNLRKAQKRQKYHHDQHARDSTLRVGERVFVHTPTLKKGPAYKLASPFKGPYRVVATHDNGVEIVPVANPRSPPIRVALNRVRRCPDEVNLPGEALTSVTRAEEPPSREDNPEAKERGKHGGTHCQPQPPGGEASHQEADRDNSGGATWARRLRPRKPQLGDELV